MGAQAGSAHLGAVREFQLELLCVEPQSISTKTQLLQESVLAMADSMHKRPAPARLCAEGVPVSSEC